MKTEWRELLSILFDTPSDIENATCIRHSRCGTVFTQLDLLIVLLGLACGKAPD